MQKQGEHITLTVNGKKMTGAQILSAFSASDTKHGTTKSGKPVKSPAYKRFGNDIVILGQAGTLDKGITVMTSDDFSVLAAHASTDSAFAGATTSA